MGGQTKSPTNGMFDRIEHRFGPQKYSPSKSKPRIISRVVKNAAAKPDEMPAVEKVKTIGQILLEHRKIVTDNSGSSGTKTEIASGFVYIISNPAWPGWIKVGSAIDYEARLRMFQTSSPLRDYRLEYVLFFKDRLQAERQIHGLLASCRSSVDGEWFSVDWMACVDLMYSVKKSMDGE